MNSKNSARAILIFLGLSQCILTFLSWKNNDNNKEIYKKSLVPGIISLVLAYLFPNFYSLLISFVLTLVFLVYFYKSLSESEKKIKAISKWVWINLGISVLYLVGAWYVYSLPKVNNEKNVVLNDDTTSLSKEEEDKVKKSEKKMNLEFQLKNVESSLSKMDVNNPKKPNLEKNLEKIKKTLDFLTAAENAKKAMTNLNLASEILQEEPNNKIFKENAKKDLEEAKKAKKDLEEAKKALEKIS